MAVELDGDKYHGPDKWADDVRRQRALERLGWIFWRCWGSAWIADRERCIADLRANLQRLGIEPLGMGEIDGSVTEHIEVAPPASAEAILAGPSRGALTPAQQTLDFNFAVRAPQSSVALNIAPPSGGTSIRTDAPELATTGPIAARGSKGLFADLDGMLVEVGDLVFTRYDDQPERPLSVRLSNTTNNPDEGVVHVKQPLGVPSLAHRWTSR